jgi:hypothetical protein
MDHSVVSEKQLSRYFLSASKHSRFSEQLVEAYQLVNFSHSAFIKYANVKEFHGLLVQG